MAVPTPDTDVDKSREKMADRAARFIVMDDLSTIFLLFALVPSLPLLSVRIPVCSLLRVASSVQQSCALQQLRVLLVSSLFFLIPESL